MKARVKKDVCIGCGLCVDICPQVFVLGDENIAETIVERVGAEVKNACREAAKNCPVDAIEIEE
jgi:ferredoxin